MVDQKDSGTMSMVFKRPRGRPSTGKAKSAAQRMREYRSRHVTVNTEILAAAIAPPSIPEEGDFSVYDAGYERGEIAGARFERQRLQELLHQLVLDEIRGKGVSLQESYRILFVY